MQFGHLQNGILWVNFVLEEFNLVIPKKWSEVATTSEIHKEMLQYHLKYKRLVTVWMWRDIEKGLSALPPLPGSKYLIGDIVVFEHTLILVGIGLNFLHWPSDIHSL